jgi:hypothetical protein
MQYGGENGRYIANRLLDGGLNFKPVYNMYKILI